MDKLKSPCSAVFHGLCVSPWGAINPCCATYGSHFKQMDSNTNIRDYWYKDEYLINAKKIELTDSWLKECKRCKIKEENGLVSRKDKMNKWYPYINSNFTDTHPDSVVHFDINFGTSCSQKCIMCNSSYSSKWLTDDRKLAEEKNPLRVWNELPLKNWSISYDQLDQIASLVTEETKKVEIKGGEPLYDKRFEYFVNSVLKQNPNVKFNINTNGTHFTEKNIDLLNKIPRINIDVSFDGTGKIYEWIRSTNWKKSVKNWDNALKYLKHPINLNYTTMCYNVDHIKPMYEWVAEKSQKFGIGILCSFTQVVVAPKYMAPEYASSNRLTSALKQIEYIIEDPKDICPIRYNNKTTSIFQERLQILYNYIKTHVSKKYDNQHYQNFKDMHSTLTKIRGWDIHDYINM